MKNKRIKSLKRPPMWLLVGLEKGIFTQIEVVREMKARGCTTTAGSFNVKMSMDYKTPFNAEEKAALKIIKPLLISKKRLILDKIEKL